MCKNALTIWGFEMKSEKVCYMQQPWHIDLVFISPIEERCISEAFICLLLGGMENR
jgi:hypothetical protein